MSIDLYFDGLCEPHTEGGRRNPGGRGCFGWVVRRGSSAVRVIENGEIIAHGRGCIGYGAGITNNVAEYRALIEGLQYVRQYDGPPEHVYVYGDSMLVVRQMRGHWRVKAALLQPLHDEAIQLCEMMEERFRLVQFGWINREKNEDADRLSRLAYVESGLDVARLGPVPLPDEFTRGLSVTLAGKTFVVPGLGEELHDAQQATRQRNDRYAEVIDEAQAAAQWMLGADDPEPPWLDQSDPCPKCGGTVGHRVNCPLGIATSEAG